MARKRTVSSAKDDTKDLLKKQQISCNQSILKKITSNTLKGIYANGSGTTNFVGTVKILLENEIINISWEKISNGRPHISVYKLDSDYSAADLTSDYLPIIDESGKIILKWNAEKWVTKPKVSTYKEEV